MGVGASPGLLAPPCFANVYQTNRRCREASCVQRYAVTSQICKRTTLLSPRAGPGIQLQKSGAYTTQPKGNVLSPTSNKIFFSFPRGLLSRMLHANAQLLALWRGRGQLTSGALIARWPPIVAVITSAGFQSSCWRSVSPPDASSTCRWSVQQSCFRDMQLELAGDYSSGQLQ